MTDDPFSGLRLPDPPPDLGPRVLAAARAAFDRSPAPAPDGWSRLARSRAARLAWAASIVLLAAAHVVLSRRPGTAPSPQVREPGADPEMVVIATLPRIDERAFSGRSGGRS